MEIENVLNRDEREQKANRSRQREIKGADKNKIIHSMNDGLTDYIVRLDGRI